MKNQDDDKTRTYVVLINGTMVHHYRIVEKIGAGGMGEVYLAEDTKLKRQVALKFMPNHLAVDKDMRLRFKREAQAAAKLDHPNIVPVYEVGEFNNRPFFAMAHIEGKSLRHIIKEGKLSLPESIRLIMQICEGLQKAHEAGVVHRDIKPANIIIDNSNRARILDFGLATVTGEEKLTKTGSTLGTVGYMAPEQIIGNKVDKRADLFSVGVIFYEMVTGRRPFLGDNDAAVVKAITDTIPEPIARFKSGTTGELQQVINKSIAKDPSIRYQHADGMIADLKRLSVESEVTPKSKPMMWAVVSVVAIACIYFAFTMLSESSLESAKVDPPVLLVLPFKNLGADDDKVFSSGIRQEIDYRLSMIKGLRMIASGSGDKYEVGKRNYEQIGRETGANFVLEATIQWDGSGEIDRFRITPKLIKTSDSYLMWSDKYDQQMVMAKVFEVQSEIATKIVTALGLTLLDSESQAPDYAPTTSMEAYNYYLRGLDKISKGVWLSDLPFAIAMFDSAVAIDPNFAVAWAQKSVVHSRYEFGYIVDDNSSNAVAAKEAADRALELDPLLPAGHIAQGWYYNLIKGEYQKSLDEFSLAKVEIAHNADLLEGIGVVKMRQGKWDESIESFENSAKADPLSVRRYFWLSLVHSYKREYDKASHYIDRGHVLGPTDNDAIFYRIFLNLLQFGSATLLNQSLESIAGEVSVAGVASYELSPSLTIGLWRFMIDQVDPELMIADLRNLRDERSPFFINLNIGQIFDLIGQEDSARFYYDSSKILLNRYVAKGTDDFHVYSPLGLTYAFLGMADSAIWAAQKGKELMPVDDCFL